MLEHLDIQIIELGDDYLKASMPVDHRTRQPMGLLHGGASLVLAESLGSIAGNLAVEAEYYCVGLEINGNHISSLTEGLITGQAKPIHIGKTTQVWEIKISSETGKLVCISRLTLAVLKSSTK